MIPEKLAFVDIETSGTRVVSDRIIEIGILRVENNQLTQTFHSLINPQTYVSPFIENYTGISKDDLEQAPTFSEIKDQLAELLDDCVFVAHNVRFDYGFLKNEFARYDIPFSPQQLCTVKLSKQLFPQHKRHNLDALIERFGLECPKRHRAFEDATVLWQFFQIIQKEKDADSLGTILKNMMRRPSLPAHLSPKTIEALPTSPGVYIFYDSNNYPLYVGKSKNIKERVLSHFSNDYASSREMQLCQQVDHVETLPTLGELGALLYEAQLVKQLQPLYNRQLRHLRRMIVAKQVNTDNGYMTIDLDTLDQVNTNELTNTMGIFKSRKQAKDYLQNIAKEHSLCHKLLNLEKSSGACFPYQLGWCKGACIGLEPAERYNLRVMMAFVKTAIKPWPFTGPIVIKERDIVSNTTQRFIIDNWCLVGIATAYAEGEAELTEQPFEFDVDTYKILERYIRSPKNRSSISTTEAVPLLAKFQAYQEV